MKETDGYVPQSIFKVTTHSITDILAAGGATAYANRMGKNPGELAAILRSFPKEAFLTDEEANAALACL